MTLTLTEWLQNQCLWPLRPHTCGQRRELPDDDTLKTVMQELDVFTEELDDTGDQMQVRGMDATFTYGKAEGIRIALAALKRAGL